MVTLDATAGHRMMWPNKTPPMTVFLDKEVKMAVPPDIFADNRKTPFRDDVFDLIIFDPPYFVRPPPWFATPERKGKWYGTAQTKREILLMVYKAQEEFKRILKRAGRVCLQWNDCHISLWNILPFFTKNGWREVYRKAWPSKGTGKTTTTSYWVTFVSCSQFTNKGEDDER